MLIKTSSITSIVAILGLLTMPKIAQAKDIESYEDYRNYCSPAAYQYGIQSPDCDRVQNIYKNRVQEELEQEQIRRRKTEKVTKDITQNNHIKGYVGGSLGAFFSTGDTESETFGEIDSDTGFGGSLFAGAKFNRYFATDLEFMLLGGEAEPEFFGNSDDLDYSQWGVLINPRFILPLSKKENAVALFLSPGLGISQGEISLDFDDDGEFIFVSEDNIRFAWQVKLGISVPFGDRYSGFTQVRYVNPTGDLTADLVSTEAGFAIEF